MRLSDQNWRHYRMRTRSHALRFINVVGFCYAFTPGPGSLPSLFEVLDTRSDHVRWAWAWDWKEALPTAKRAFYGRVLARKPTFISMALLPYFYALTGNVGQADDQLRLYSEGRLTAMARRVYELLADRGRLTTRQIRAEVEPDRRGSSARLLRALGELQNLFLLARVGEVGDNPGNYAYEWDLFERWLPDVVTQASAISHRAAAARVLEQYVRIAGTPRPADAASLFAWSPRITGTAVADLQEAGTLSIVRGRTGEDRLMRQVRAGQDRRRRP